MRLRFYVPGGLIHEVACTAAPDRGDRIALDGVTRQVASRRWDFWTNEADPVVNLYLEDLRSVRGPKPTVKKAKGKKPQ